MGAERVSSTSLRGLAIAIVAAVFALTLSAACAVPQAQADSGLQGVKLSTQWDNPEEVTTPDGIVWNVYFDGGTVPTSVFIKNYTGTATELKIPTSIEIKGQTVSLTGSGTEIMVAENAFKENTTLTKIAFPKNTANIGTDAFADCLNLKEYWIDGEDFWYGQTPVTSGKLGQDSSGNVYPGVTVHTPSGGKVDTEVKAINQKSKTTGNGNTIAVMPDADPYNNCGIGEASDDGMGEDGTEFGKGASESVVDKALTDLASEKDQAGMVFNVLRAKASKVTKNSVKLSWAKANGAAKYVIYGAKCGNNKLVKLDTKTGKSATLKSVADAKVKKGTYYKFVVVALDDNGKVVSTSKMVHAATKGGKVGNDKKVTTAAKKNKASVKAGKTFKLKAKTTPESKKLKVKRHRKTAYESTDTSVATVNAKGAIKGVAKGSCFVYAYSQNGVCAKVKVTVK